MAVESDVTVKEALNAMVDHNIGAVVVTESGKLAGIFSERDLVRMVHGVHYLD